MSQVSSYSSNPITDTTMVNGETAVVDEVAVENAETLSVSYSEEHQSRTTGNSSQRSSGDGADVNGLSYPADIDLKDALLILGSNQSEIAEDQLEFSAEQMTNLTSERSDLAAKNIEKLSQMREKAEQAEKWGEFGRIAGYIATGLTLVAGLACPAMMVAGIAMLTMTCLNETGATEDIIKALSFGNDDTVLGTVLLGIAIVGISVASGGAAGVAIFTTMAPGMLFSAENCENMGMDSEAAMWVSLSVGIGVALLGGVGAIALSKSSSALRAGSQAAKSGTTASQTASTSANTASTTAKTASTTAKTTSTTATTSAKTASSTTATAKTGTQTANAATTTTRTATGAAQTSAKTTETLNSASQKLMQVIEEQTDQIRESQSLMQKLSSARLEKMIQHGLDKAAKIASKLGVASDAGKDAVTTMNKYTMLTQTVMDTFTTATKAVYADYNYDVAVLQADADYIDAEMSYTTERYNAWKSIMDQASTNYQTRVSKMTDAIHDVHDAVVGHLRAI
ncbi:hypothetical protein AB1L42_01575 [Thalassoglobus sp. JC818]|uniref:hypothetical protein n=1 Tax=Thalassoglobus sp. JC818 TaxID=3232136 RepID=UPI003458D782